MARRRQHTRRVLAALALPGALAAAQLAAEPCKLARVAELPVTMVDTRPLVHAAINGRDALFIADSGSSSNVLTPAAAKNYQLPLDVGPYGMSGVGGAARAWITTVKTFTLFGKDFRGVPFFVAGNDLDSGAVGVLGQKLLMIGDVDYDLANGLIKIMRTHGDCSHASLAYWANAGGTPYSEIGIRSASEEQPATVAVAYLNGSKITVEFDTGAWASHITLDAARRAGITPDSPGVIPAGMASGVGRQLVQTWIAPFASFRIGDEEVRNTHLRIGAEDLGEVDMLIGADFFLSHHILVANSQNRLYFTYNGGPVFNLTTTPAAPGAEAPAAAAGFAQPAPDAQLDAGGYARRGSAFAARRDYRHALADLSHAIQLEPGKAEYFYERGAAYAAAQLPAQALADYSEAIRLAPDDVPALMARAALRVARNDPTAAVRPDLDAADRAAPRAAEMRLDLGDLYRDIHAYPAAITQYGYWIDAHNQDEIDMPRARASRCWTWVLEGTELDRALEDCDFAIRKRPTRADFIESRGFVYLRQGNLERAIADYDAALALDARLSWAFYGRGLAKLRLGHAEAGRADIAAATALAPRIAEWAAREGIGP